MIDFDEEIKKFKPSLEVEEAEDAIYNNNVPDIADLLGRMMQEAGAGAGAADSKRGM